MGAAKHLAVGEVGGTAARPGCDVVGVHLGETPNARPVGIVPYGAIRAVRDAGRLCGLGLGGVDRTLDRLVKDAHIQQAGRAGSGRL